MLEEQGSCNFWLAVLEMRDQGSVANLNMEVVPKSRH